jgi:hypothetical protein
MAVIFGSILALGNSGSEATLDSINLKGTTLLVNDFSSASLATIGPGLTTAPGKRKLGTIISTTGSINSLPEYYVFHNTSSGDLNLSGSEWTNTTNWEKLAFSSQISGAFSNVTNVTITELSSTEVSASHITASNISASILSASDILVTNNLEVDGDFDLSGSFIFQGFQFSDSAILNHTGSNTFGSGSSSPSALSHEFTGSIKITGSGIFPLRSESGDIMDLGSSTQKWTNLYAVNTYFGGIHEINLETRGLHNIQEGTILSLKNGTLQPCEFEGDPLVMAVTSKEGNYPIVMGAEPILITGKVEEGDYIITSNIKGHGKAVNPEYIYDKQLFGKIIAQSLEKGEGLSYLIKAMIRKM